MRVFNRTSRAGRRYKWRDYSGCLAPCPYPDSQLHPWFRAKTMCIGNRICNVLTHVFIHEDSNVLSCAALFQGQNDWKILPISPDIRHYININGDYLVGQQQFDQFMLNSITKNQTDDRNKLLRYLNNNYSQFADVFQPRITLILIKPEFRSWYDMTYIHFPFAVVMSAEKAIKDIDDNWLLDKNVYIEACSIDHLNNDWHRKPNNNIDVTQTKTIQGIHAEYVGPLFQRCEYQQLIQFDPNHEQTADANAGQRTHSIEALRLKYQACLKEKITNIVTKLQKYLKADYQRRKRIYVTINAAIISDLENLMLTRCTKFMTRMKTRHPELIIKWHRCARNDYLRINVEACNDTAHLIMFANKLTIKKQGYKMWISKLKIRIDKKLLRLIVEFKPEFKLIASKQQAKHSKTAEIINNKQNNKQQSNLDITTADMTNNKGN